MSVGSSLAGTSHRAQLPSPLGQYGDGPSPRKKIAGLWFGRYFATSVVWHGVC